MLKIVGKGSTKNIEAYLKSLSTKRLFSDLDEYGQRGVRALASATPKDSGKTADSWTYKIKQNVGLITIEWTNSNVIDGNPIAIMLQYGHGTGTGGWVAGRDYINPAIRPVFDSIANDVWKKVTHG